MNIKLIALDLDGTTLSPDSTVTPVTHDTILQAIDHGIEIVICTGRSNTELHEIYEQLPPIRYYICGNGCKIYDHEQKTDIYKTELPFSEALKYLDLCQEMQVMPEIYLEGKIYTPQQDYAKLDYYLEDPDFAELVRQTRIPVADIRKLLKDWQKPVEKFDIIYKTKEEHRQLVTFCQQNQASFTDALAHNIEIGGEGADKGTALSVLAKLLQIKPANIMAIGDSNNDLPMFAYAGFSVAMANSTPEIIAAATHHTVSNHETENGVAAAIKKYALP